MNHQQIREELSRAEATLQQHTAHIEKLRKMLETQEVVRRPFDENLKTIERSAKAIYRTVHHGHPTSCEPGADEQHIIMHTDLIIECVNSLRSIVKNMRPDIQEAVRYFSDKTTMAELERDYPHAARRIKLFISAQISITTLGDELNVLLGDA